MLLIHGWRGVTGFAALSELEEQHGVVAELATEKLVVFALGPGSTVAHAQALAHALAALCSADAQKIRLVLSGHDAADPTATVARSRPPAPCADITGRQPQHVLPQMQLTPREAFFAESEAVPAAEAVGRVSAELLCPYPPGVPVLFPGEVLTQRALDVLQDVLCAGGVITGPEDSSLQTLRVVRA